MKAIIEIKLREDTSKILTGGFPSNFYYYIEWRCTFDGEIVDRQIGPVPKKIAIELGIELLEASLRMVL